MSEYKVPCELVQDLLPLYLDGLTSEETAKRIGAHLQTCENCRQRYDNLNASMGCNEEEKKLEEQKEIDYLKKVKKSNKKKLFIGFVTAVLIVLVFVFIKVYFTGSEADNYVITDISRDLNHSRAVIEGTISKTKSVYCRYKMITQDDGKQKIIIYGCPPSPWRKNADFKIYIPFSDITRELEINGTTIDKHGGLTSSLAYELVRLRNPYVGDMPANGRLAQLLGISESMGEYENELQTDKEPYGWTLKFKNVVTDSYSFDRRMEVYASLLMATIDNLDKVTWTYMEKFPSTMRLHTASITRSECDKFAGTMEPGIKSPHYLQIMIDYLDKAEYLVE